MLDIGASAGQDFIVMEYLEGITLRQTIKERGPLPEKEAVQICIQICAALSAAHGKEMAATSFLPKALSPKNFGGSNFPSHPKTPG